MIMVISPNKRHLEALAKERARQAREQMVSAVAPAPDPVVGSEPKLDELHAEPAAASDEG